jgi:hypothetical protein
MVILSEVAVSATSGDFAVCADCVGPVFEELAVLETDVDYIGLEAGGADGVIPSGEKLRDGMLGDS